MPPTVLLMPSKPRVSRSSQLLRTDEQVERARQVGQRISLARTEAGLSQQALAARLGGVDPRTLKAWERGDTTKVKVTQTLVDEAEGAAGGAVTQGRGPNALFVGHSCELLYQIELELKPFLHEGDLTQGLYRPQSEADSLEARIQREPGIDRGTKDAILVLLQAARSR